MWIHKRMIRDKLMSVSSGRKQIVNLETNVKGNTSIGKKSGTNRWLKTAMKLKDGTVRRNKMNFQ